MTSSDQVRTAMSTESPVDDRYRIEADECMRDYDALELDAGVMVEALLLIANGRRNKRFDPWAQEVARTALDCISDRARDIRPDRPSTNEFLAWASVQP